MKQIPQIPILRFGQCYQSMDYNTIVDQRTGNPIALVGQANTGLISKDVLRVQESFDALNQLSCARLIEISKKAGHLFMNESLPLSEEGDLQSPQEYVEVLSATSGLPYNLCRSNMTKIHEVFTEMENILHGLTRGLDPRVIDQGFGVQNNRPVSFFPETTSMGVVLPSNSPGVNSIWMPAIPLKIPVILKPGRDEPWTPFRIIQSFIAAGCPKEAFGFYPTSHGGANTIMSGCGRSIIFGDENTVSQYAKDPTVQVHGPGWSKILLGDDCVESWPVYIDIIADSIVKNSGRSCINASTVFTPKYRTEIAIALAERLAPIQPESFDSEDAILSAFVNTAFAEYIDAEIERGLSIPGAEDVTAPRRNSPRKIQFENLTYLLPTLVSCDSFSHPLARREFLFPYASVAELPCESMLDEIGESLVVTAITQKESWIQELMRSSHIKRLNIGPISTCCVSWDQPHEGNLFEFLYSRRAVQYSDNLEKCSV